MSEGEQEKRKWQTVLANFKPTQGPSTVQSGGDFRSPFQNLDMDRLLLFLKLFEGAE